MGRVAAVTGGTGSLGRRVVRTLVEDGWRVHVPSHSDDAAAALREYLGDSAGEVVLGSADLTDPRSVAAWFGAVEAGDGGLDALCSLVGGFAMAPVEDTEPATWDRMLALNATTAFLAARSAVPLLRAGGGGRIVHVASLPGLEGAARMAAYGAAKAAVVGLTRSLAEELVADGVTVNAVAPSILDTEANREAMPDADTSTWLDPAAVARVVRFLVSPDAAVVTGSVLTLRRG